MAAPAQQQGAQQQRQHRQQRLRPAHGLEHAPDDGAHIFRGLIGKAGEQARKAQIDSAAGIAVGSFHMGRPQQLHCRHSGGQDGRALQAGFLLWTVQQCQQDQHDGKEDAALLHGDHIAAEDQQGQKDFPVLPAIQPETNPGQADQGHQVVHIEAGQFDIAAHNAQGKKRPEYPGPDLLFLPGNQGQRGGEAGRDQHRLRKHLEPLAVNPGHPGKPVHQYGAAQGILGEINVIVRSGGKSIPGQQHLYRRGPVAEVIDIIKHLTKNQVQGQTAQQQPQQQPWRKQRANPFPFPQAVSGQSHTQGQQQPAHRQKYPQTACHE